MLEYVAYIDRTAPSYTFCSWRGLFRGVVPLRGERREKREERRYLMNLQPPKLKKVS